MILQTQAPPFAISSNCLDKGWGVGCLTIASDSLLDFYRCITCLVGCRLSPANETNVGSKLLWPSSGHHPNQVSNWTLVLSSLAPYSNMWIANPSSSLCNQQQLPTHSCLGMTGLMREVYLVTPHHKGHYGKACASHALPEVACTKTLPVIRGTIIVCIILLCKLFRGIACIDQ